MLEKLKALELRYEDLQNQLGDPKVYSDSERLRQVKAQEAAEKQETQKPVKEKTNTERPARGDRAQQAAKKQLTICEREIAKAEEKIAALDAEMEANACDYEKLNTLVADKDAAQAELDALYQRWEELSEAAGEV